MIDLTNINIILTGSTGILGGSILKTLSEANANIIATGTNQNKLDIIKKKYPKIITKQFDIFFKGRFNSKGIHGRWSYYPEPPLLILGGITYKFDFQY